MKTAFLLFALPIFTSAIDIKLKIHPQSEDPKRNLIWFNQSTYDLWSEKLDNYIEVYRTPELTEGRSNNLVKCDYTLGSPKESEKVCKVDVEAFNPCVVTNYFGYKKLKPCVFVELQKIIEWRPKFYNSTESLPENMPKRLKDHIDVITLENSALWETVWVDCDGETTADREFIGPIKYTPYHGFPGYLFPYTGQKAYLNPILAVSFHQPMRGVVINVICRAWSPEIRHHAEEGYGVVKFQLLVDNWAPVTTAP